MIKTKKMLAYAQYLFPWTMLDTSQMSPKEISNFMKSINFSTFHKH
jgi:hypothetical protein